jgi:hypothetical protein
LVILAGVTPSPLRAGYAISTPLALIAYGE